jgi:uncharacterized protein YjbI with pentapeptide repeats/outer membrane protein OmpA-like peptidoglycan-associated protein
LVTHAYTLLHFMLLGAKAKRFDVELRRQVTAPEVREGLRWQLPSDIFVEFLAGPREVRHGWLGVSLRAIGLLTLVIAPVLLLLLVQVQFLPYHNQAITWCHRGAVFADLALVWLTWPAILIGSSDFLLPTFRRGKVAALTTAFTLLISFTIATYPGEFIDRVLPSVRLVPTTLPPLERRDLLAPRRLWSNLSEWWLDSGDTKTWTSLQAVLFYGKVDPIGSRRYSLFSSTIVAPSIRLAKLDNSGNFIVPAVSLRGRDLYGAVLIEADLRGVDLTGTDLKEASLVGADLRGATFCRTTPPEVPVLNDSTPDRVNCADLSWANLRGANLESSNVSNVNFEGAQFQQANLGGTWFNGADMRGSHLSYANLPGASLNGADLQCADFVWANLRGAQFSSVNLQGADLSRANLAAAKLSGDLRGADFKAADLTGALLDGANLEGASFQDTTGSNVSVVGAIVWRADIRGSKLSKIRASNLDYAVETYNPRGVPLMIPWTHKDYLDVRYQTNRQHGCPSGTARRVSALDPAIPLADQAIAQTWRAAVVEAAGDNDFNSRLEDTWRLIACGTDTPYVTQSITLLMSRSPEWYCPDDFCSTLAKSLLDEPTCPTAGRLSPAYKAELHKIETVQHGAEYRINEEIRARALAAKAQIESAGGTDNSVPQAVVQSDTGSTGQQSQNASTVESRTVHFGFMDMSEHPVKADIPPSDIAILDEEAEMLKQHPHLRIFVNGYSDSLGNETGCIARSGLYVKAVIAYLEGKGVSSDQFIPQAFGRKNFLGSNQTAEGRAANRRVELIPADSVDP